MPGFELVGKEEKKELNRIFEDGIFAFDES